MNPLGFTLENFDAVGRYRDKEHGKPIDASGGYETRAGTTAKFTGASELAKFLADSPEVHAAFVDPAFPPSGEAAGAGLWHRPARGVAEIVLGKRLQYA